MEEENYGNKEIKALLELRLESYSIISKLLEIPRHDEAIRLKIENAIKVAEYVNKRFSRIYPYC